MGGRLSGSWLGGARVVAVALLLSLAPFLAAGADAPRLVYAGNGVWESDLILTSGTSTEPGSFKATNCTFGPSGVDVAIPAEGTVVVADFGQALCGAPIGVIPFAASDLAGVTVYLRYHDAAGNGTAFEVPPLTWTLRAGETGEIQGIQSNAERDTALVVFNEGASVTLLQVAVYDGANAPVAVESFAIAPGMNFFLLGSHVDAGRIELRQGGITVGCPGCTFDEPLYGFAAVGVRGGGSQRVRVFAPKLRVEAE